MIMKALLSHEKLQKYMAENQFKQEPFAELIGVSDRQVRNWLKRDVDISLSVFYNLLQVFGIPMDELLIFQDE